jgi:hypothetical protein
VHHFGQVEACALVAQKVNKASGLGVKENNWGIA